jgi:glutamate racemase
LSNASGMLGLYDSGLGGLTVLTALRDAGIEQDILYFADQAHVPYGDRTEDELAALLAENFAYLGTQGVDAIVMACNTSCAVAARRGWPATDFPVLDVIANGAKSLAGQGFRRIAVIATAATVRSGAYGTAIRLSVPGSDVREIAAPALVPLVEAGAAGTPEAAAAVAAVVREIPHDIDAIVYGCTHYPLLDAEFAAAFGAGIARVDPARAQAAAAVELMRGRTPAGRGFTHYRTNGDLAAFARNVRRWMGAAATENATIALTSTRVPLGLR